MEGSRETLVAMVTDTGGWTVMAIGEQWAVPEIAGF
jgi:hypothetical protein